MEVTKEMVIDGSAEHKFDHTEAATTKVRKPVLPQTLNCTFPVVFPWFIPLKGKMAKIQIYIQCI